MSMFFICLLWTTQYLIISIVILCVCQYSLKRRGHWLFTVGSVFDLILQILYDFKGTVCQFGELRLRIATNWMTPFSPLPLQVHDNKLVSVKLGNAVDLLHAKATLNISQLEEHWNWISEITIFAKTLCRRTTVVQTNAKDKFRARVWFLCFELIWRFNILEEYFLPSGKGLILR